MFRNRLKTRTRIRGGHRLSQAESLENRILLAADFGDAPEGITVDGVLRNYPTLAANNGAQHNVNLEGPFLGASAPDMEADGQPSSDATGDGADEDGITIAGEVSGPNMVGPGENFTATATVFGTGVVNVFVDWNIDGDWDDANEWVIQNEPFTTGMSPVPVTIPPVDLTAPLDVVPGSTFFRVRVSDVNVTGPGGAAGNGEVEDYQATILPGPCSLTVTTTDDVVDGSDSVNSLREAITCANETSGHDTVTVPTGVYDLDIDGAGDDTNAVGDLDLLDDITIVSATGDPNDVTISGGEEFDDRVFHVHGVEANITGVRIAGGFANPGEAGGGLLNEFGTLTLTDSIVNDNFAPVGGGIATIHEMDSEVFTLTLVNTQVTGNVAAGDEGTNPQGGGVYAFNDTVEIFDGSVIADNLANSFGGTPGAAEGGGIYIEGGSLTIDRSTVSGNRAVGVADGGTSIFDGRGEGGGVFAVFADSLISDSVIENNSAEGADKTEQLFGSGGLANGGGIYNDGIMTIGNTLISGNTAIGGNAAASGGASSEIDGGWGWGGGIFNQGDLVVSVSTISMNIAEGGDGIFDGEANESGNGGSGWGGGIFAGGSPDSLSVIDSTISLNSAIGGEGGDQGGIGGDGLGGAIFTDALDTVVFGSTINENLAQGGGAGFLIDGQVGTGAGGGVWIEGSQFESLTDVINSTISGNRASTIAGGLYVGVAQGQSVLIRSSTVVENEVEGAGDPVGAGVFHDDTGDVQLDNTIVANNVRNNDGGAVPDDMFGQFLGVSNLIGNGFGMSGLVNGVDGNQVGTSGSPIDPGIEPLADNGGLTETHALQATSLAINAGDNALAVDGFGNTLDFDQRGTGFPRISNGTIDIGAFEVGVCSLVVTHTGDSGVGSLREAIICANVTPGLDTITFEIPGDGPHEIVPDSPLPAVTDPVIIDGYSQGASTGTTTDDATPNTLAIGNDAVLKIVLNGSNAGSGAEGLRLDSGSDGSTIAGLNIHSFDDDAIQIFTDSNTVRGNFIGTDVTGLINLGNDDEGVDIASAADNLIGGPNPADRNVISGNEDGVNIAFPESTGNRVENNYIGLNAAGTAAIPNTDDGVDLDSASNNLVIGNVVSGNEDDGVEIDGGFDVEAGDASFNRIQSNLIGLNATGDAAIPNETDGVSIQGASRNTVGGDDGLGNVISGNGFDGVFIVEFGANNNLVVGNLIGTDITGTMAIGNQDDGVDICFGPQNNIVADNVISGNSEDGVTIEEAFANAILDNLIGLAVDSTTPLGNASRGVNIVFGSGNQIGDSSESGNVIAHNGEEGVLVAGFAFDNSILGNSIFSNGSLGIDLIGFDDDIVIEGEQEGVTLNDPGDGDNDGGNRFQNFPVLTSFATGATTVVEGTLNSLPFENFRIEFFSNEAIDPSGFGEGQTFLGFVNVFTDSSGNASFTFDAGQVVADDDKITSTATWFEFDFGEDEGEGEQAPMFFRDTSEFSQPAPPELAADLELSKEVDIVTPAIGETITFTLTLTNAGPGDATGVEVTDALPTGLNFVSALASQGTYDDGTGIWDVGSLAFEEAATLEIMTIVQNTEQITNIAEVTASDQVDPDSTPGNGLDGAGEDDFATAGVGQCLFGLDGPLQVGLNRLVYVCPTPGSISAFVQGTEFGNFYFDLYDQDVDIDDPEVVALGVANPDGVAVVHVHVPPAMAGGQIIFQAFEMEPNSHLSNLLVMDVAAMPVVAEAGEGAGAESIVRADIDEIFEEAKARWAATDLTAAEQARLDNAHFRLLNLPDGLLGSALGSTIFIDRNAAGHGWFVDSTPADDSEFELAVSTQERITTLAPAADRIDLLTVVMHELGHVLGHADQTDGGLMHFNLTDSTRRFPTDLPEAEISHPLHRFGFAEDVDGDGNVTLADALAVVSHLRRHGSGETGDIIRRLGSFGLDRIDVTGDNRVSLTDALMIVARLRNSLGGEAEADATIGGSTSTTQLSLDSAVDAPLAESEDSSYSAAVDAVLASYSDDDQ